jgi:hypothetical protein
MNWTRKAQSQPIGHGNTLNGERIARELRRIASEVQALRAEAAAGGPDDVLPRWRGDVRRMILMLPSTSALERMSMYELEEASARLDEVRASMDRYSAGRFREIMGDAR